jgi:hypothetical protein
MPNESISFCCPACNIKLTVPGSLAGVTGPCPSCQTQIRAPYPLTSPLTSAQEPSPAPVDVLPPAIAPLTFPDSIPTSQPASLQSATPHTLKPEPRQLPSRAPQGEPVSKQARDSYREIDASRSAQPQRHHHRSGFYRLILPATCAIATAAIVYGVIWFLHPTINTNLTSGTRLKSTVRSILSEDSKPKKQPASSNQLEPAKSEPHSALPATAPQQPVIADPPPSLPDGLEPITPGSIASEILDKFLAAKNLSERIPMIETQTPLSELEKSCLSGPLPAAASIWNDGQESNTVERVVDVFFSVDFDMGKGQKNPQTILVRIRGAGDAKVVIDPFLDSFGGRLAAYAKTPMEHAAEFQVIIWAIASCNDERVPDREKKLTLQLLPRDNSKEIARAYFGRQSKIGMMLEDGTYSISYGKAKACTVLLRWNSEDNPAMPYLEALDIKALDWNP